MHAVQGQSDLIAASFLLVSVVLALPSTSLGPLATVSVTWSLFLQQHQCSQWLTHKEGLGWVSASWLTSGGGFLSPCPWATGGVPAACVQILELHRGLRVPMRSN